MDPSEGNHDPLGQLKQLLFREEIERVDTISDDLNDEEKLEKKIEPILEKRIAALQAEFPDQFGPVITAALKVQIKESQEEVVEAIYPIMGKLIKKFIQREIKRLSETIDERIRETMSFKNILQRMKFRASGVKTSDVIVQGLLPPTLEEVMVIENESGLLIANYSPGDTADADMVAGMLTAIKAFIEDVYSRKSQSLETIEYETLTLYVQSFRSFYVAVAVSGVVNEQFKDKLNDAIFALAVKLTEDKRYREDADEMEKLIAGQFKLLSGS